MTECPLAIPCFDSPGPESASSNAQGRALWNTKLASAAPFPYKVELRSAVVVGRAAREAWVTNKEAADRIAWERTVIRRVRAGDGTAFAELYRAYARVLYRRVLLPKLGAAGAAEDALAETFRTAIMKLDSYEDQGVSIYHWLARIASNKAMDMHRARARTGRALTQLERLLAPLEWTHVHDPFDELSARREQVVLEARIAAALSMITPRYRRAIELRFLEERERQACADALDVRLGTFDVLLLRALRAFRIAWDQCEALHVSARPVRESEAQDDG